MQQMARYPYGNPWCASRYEHLSAVPKTHRVAIIDEVLLFYRVIEDERIILFVHAQTTAMNVPSATIFLTERP
jgi:hypothetical protein